MHNIINGKFNCAERFTVVQGGKIGISGNRQQIYTYIYIYIYIDIYMSWNKI